MKILDGIPIKPCVRCGECCKASACGFGVYDHSRKQCRYLVPLPLQFYFADVGMTGAEMTAQGVTLYTCNIAQEIEKDPSSEFSPAFGAGCCRNLGNPVRDHIVKVLKEKQ